MKVNNILKARMPFFVVLIFDSLKVILRFIIKRHKISNNDDGSLSPFFIIGSGRSGNTLLRSLLVTGNQVAIPPESYVWPRIYRKYKALSFLPWETLSSMVVSEFEAYKEFYTWEMNLSSAHLESRNLPPTKQSLANVINVIYNTYINSQGTQAKRWGDKTPINTIFIDKIAKIFPKAQYIHIVRDPRDVVCSYVKANLYDDYFEALKFWKEANRKAELLRKQLPEDRFYQIRYEDLVKSPDSELKKICDFLGVDYSPEMLLFWKNKNELGDVKYNQHHDNIGNPISTASVGKWKKILSNDELQYIETNAAEQIQKYSYL
ncbi:sulfotransferase family protein [Mangrovimonas aestuarii]|uniref:sulfotransferase family protein n=1 Tax=Mangrovimonas aestuarii TaxID=3018443 RepID=UPI0023784EAB|nr:sulfotransferase [Mangrovimonas aestuarii]